MYSHTVISSYKMPPIFSQFMVFLYENAVASTYVRLVLLKLNRLNNVVMIVPHLKSYFSSTL